ncbi:MAG: 3'(2'),5'-bisphosphate nucleotidase CysQ [Spongiibacteraceae bacterium]
MDLNKVLADEVIAVSQWDRLCDAQLLVPALCRLCAQAAAAIVEVYQSAEDIVFEQKIDRSPVTLADKKAHAIIIEGLAALPLQWPVLSEEQDDIDFELRRQWPRYWLVDPLDGTREFLDRNGEFTINIALIERGVAVLGVVYVPLSDQAYIGIPADNYAVKVEAGRSYPLPLQEQAYNHRVDSRMLRVLTSSRDNGDELQGFITAMQQHFDEVIWVKVGSALKFCLLAEGQGDIYPRFSPCSEWDTAAGQAVLEAAGGRLLDMTFKPLRYNQKPCLLNSNFYALGNNDIDWPVLLAGSSIG